MAEAITVYLLDDHEIVRLGLKELLESEGDIQVIGESGTAAQRAEQILALQPHVAVLDGRLRTAQASTSAGKSVPAKLISPC